MLLSGMVKNTIDGCFLCTSYFANVEVMLNPNPEHRETLTFLKNAAIRNA